MKQKYLETTLIGIKIGSPIPLSKCDLLDEEKQKLVIDSTAIRFKHYNLLFCLKGKVKISAVEIYNMVSVNNEKKIRYKIWSVALISSHAGNEALDFQYHNEADAIKCQIILTNWLNSNHFCQTIVLPVPLEIQHGIEVPLDDEYKEDDIISYSDGSPYYYRITSNQHCGNYIGSLKIAINQLKN